MIPFLVIRNRRTQPSASLHVRVSAEGGEMATEVTEFTAQRSRNQTGILDGINRIYRITLPIP